MAARRTSVASYALSGDWSFAKRLLNLQRETCGSFEVSNSDAPGTVRRLLKDRSTPSDYRLAIPIAVVAVEPEGRQRVLVRNVEDELDRPKRKDSKRLALVRWFELPDAFEPAQGCLEISYTDVEMVAFQSHLLSGCFLEKPSSRLRLMFRWFSRDPPLCQPEVRHFPGRN